MGTSSNNASDMPQAAESELAVLCALLFTPQPEPAADEALVLLTERDFASPANRAIFGAIASLRERGEGLDPTAAAAEAVKGGKVEERAIKTRIVEVGQQGMAAMNWREHAALVAQASLARQLVMAARKIEAIARSPITSAEETIEQAEQALFQVTKRQGFAEATPVGGPDGLAEKEYGILQERRDNGTLGGVACGLPNVDSHFNGFSAGDLVIVAARPSIGKTAFAVSLALGAAKRRARVAVFSLEMSDIQLTDRLLASDSGLALDKLQRGTLTESEWKTASDTLSDLYSLTNLRIDDSPLTSLAQIRIRARRLFSGQPANSGLVVIDYLQLMNCSGQGRAENRQVEVSEISRGLKLLAKEIEQPVIALSQLSRAVESREDRIPRLSDLRESGAIEQDADVVIFLDRSKSDEEAERTCRPDKGVMEAIVAKNRNGALGKLKFSYTPKTGRIVALASEDGKPAERAG